MYVQSIRNVFVRTCKIFHKIFCKILKIVFVFDLQSNGLLKIDVRIKSKSQRLHSHIQISICSAAETRSFIRIFFFQQQTHKNRDTCIVRKATTKIWDFQMYVQVLEVEIDKLNIISVWCHILPEIDASYFLRETMVTCSGGILRDWFRGHIKSSVHTDEFGKEAVNTSSKFHEGKITRDFEGFRQRSRAGGNS